MATDSLSPETVLERSFDAQKLSSRRDNQSTTKTDKNAWVGLCQQFLRCHRRPINVLLHLITTPLSLFAVAALANLVHPIALMSLVAAYLVVVLFMVPPRTFLVTLVCVFGLAGLAYVMQPSWYVAIAAFLVGYVGQELSHWFASERTLQSTYIGSQGALGRFLQHTVLLLPVLLVVASRRRQSPLRILVARKAVLPTQLKNAKAQWELQAIRDWVHVKEPEIKQSIHWWQNDLDGEAGEAFDRLSADSLLMSRIRRFHGAGYEVKPVLGMNELYVTGPPKQSTSDTVFYMGHVDGPWAVFPGARLYRCMLAASPNKEVTTYFPMSGADYSEAEGYRLETGDAVAFDFNRELHFITREANAEQTEPRVNLKLHFVAYPKSVRWYGSLLSRLTTVYDIRARKLFLNTIDPNSVWQKCKTKWVLGWTKIFEFVVRYVGWTNLAYVAVAATASLLVRDWRLFVLATSFVHYGMYVGTFREREPIAFRTFLRDAVFFKTIALCSLAVLYLYHFSNQWLSLALIVLGYGLATYATAVIGVRRTYFSSELGFDSPNRSRKFPYGVIPHPMILGAVAALTSMLLVPEFRENCWWLIVGHLTCYTIVLCQEIHGNAMHAPN